MHTRKIALLTGRRRDRRAGRASRAAAARAELRGRPAVRRAQAARGRRHVPDEDHARLDRACLSDPDPQVRQDAAETLGNLRDPRAAPPLLRALEAGEMVYVSRLMILELAALPGREVDAAQLRMLDARRAASPTATSVRRSAETRPQRGVDRLHGRANR